MNQQVISSRTTFKLFLGHLSLISGLGAHSLEAHAWERAIELEGSRLRVYSEAGPALQLHFEREDLLRIWFEPKGRFEREASLLRIDLPDAAVGVEFNETAEAAKFKSSRLQVEINKRDLQLKIYNSEGQLLHSNLGHASPKGAEQAPQYRWQLADEEHIFGLGQDNDAYGGSLDRRGRERDLWSNQEIRRGHVTADIPIPFLLSTGPEGLAYGLFFDTSYRSRFDLGSSQQEQASWQAPGGELDFYFIYGPSFVQILDRYTELTGRPSLPPLWALGYIQSKCTYWNWAEIDDVVDNLRTRQIPMDVMVIDYDWAQVPMDFQWADRWEGKSREKIQSYKQQGTRFLISNAGPMLRKEASNYNDAKDRGLLASDGQGNPITAGHYGGDLMDFTHPDMQSWLWPQLEPLYQDGIAGWWLDLTEPEGEPEQTQYYAGGRDKIHNQFALLNSKAYYEMQLRHHPDDRVFILTRTGTAGIQRYGSAIWTGDVFSDYQTLAAHLPEALNTGLSGIPYWTQDSGGFIEGLYKDNIEDHGRLYERWLQFASFSAITRAHKVGPSAPYMFGPEVEASSRHYLQQRYRLLPYIYSHSWEAHRRGLPLMRAMVLEFQNDPNVYGLKDQYMFGRSLLVAPVTQEGADRRQVYFPGGRWYNRDTGELHEGPTTACVAAPRERIPVFAKAGAIIPKAPLMQHSGEKPWDPLTFEIYPEGRSEFTLYQDDGQSQAFQRSANFTETQIVADLHTERELDISWTLSNMLWMPKRYELEVHLERRPLRVAYEGKEIAAFLTPAVWGETDAQWTWSESERLLRISLRPKPQLDHRLAVSLAAEALAMRPLGQDLDACEPNDPNLPDDGTPVQLPHFYPPPRLPAQVEAENYDKGGEGLAYHDRDQGNNGGAYRSDDVDLIPSDDRGGGYVVSSIEGGEWLEYTLHVPKTRDYRVGFRILNPEGRGRIRFEHDGQILGDVRILPATPVGRWAEVDLGTILLPEGQQILRVHIEEGGWLWNWFKLD